MRENLPDRHGGKDRAGKRDNYVPVDVPPTGSINKSRLLERLRDIHEELIKEENGERIGDERDDLNLVAVYPGGRAIEPWKLVHHEQERHGHGLERDKDQRHNHDDNELAARERYARKRVGDQAVDQQTQREDTGDYQRRVEHIETERKPMEGIAIVLQRDGSIRDKGIHASQILQELVLVSFQ